MVLAPALAGLYWQGLRLLHELDDPGAAHLLGHIGRELTLGAVDAVLEEGWSLSDRERAEIPDDEQHREKIARSLGLNPSDPRVTQWFELHGTFAAATHYRLGGPLPDPRKLRLGFERLEQLLYGRIGPYFRTLEELDDVLAVSEPDDSHLERLQAVLLRPQQRRYFFGKLPHANWVAPLDRLGEFSKPPERRVHADGSWQAVAWPEGEFLARVAPDQPELVVEILQRLPTSIENPVIWHVVADVAKLVPTDLARRLVPHLTKAAGNLLPVMLADGLLTLISRLADEGYQEAFDLARALLFVPSVTDVGHVSPYSSRSDWVFPRLRWTQFSAFTEEALVALERSDHERTLRLLLGKLNQIVAVARKLGSTHVGYSWFRTRGRADAYDVASQMAQATSEMLQRFASAGPEHAHRALEILAHYGGDVFRSLRYRLIAAAGQHRPDELDSLLSSSLAVEPEQWGGRSP